MPINVSVDLETWGTTPGCDIRSIGACVFDPTAGTVSGWDFTLPIGERLTSISGQFYIACDNPIIKHRAGVSYRKYSLTRDPRTAQWWNEQSDEAQAAFADPVDLHECLKRFTAWFASICPTHDDETGQPFNAPVRIWSHGAAFDPPILAAAYAAVGLPVPWHYRAPRDTRTLFDAAGVDDHSAWLAARPGPLGVPHHALEDSISQARAICDAWALLRRP